MTARIDELESKNNSSVIEPLTKDYLDRFWKVNKEIQNIKDTIKEDTEFEKVKLYAQDLLQKHDLNVNILNLATKNIQELQDAYFALKTRVTHQDHLLKTALDN